MNTITNHQTFIVEDARTPTTNVREQMDIVVIGHVDHGKSTLVGRLLADTDSLPEGKLQQVRDNCRRNAKPFEYAFLLDALKDEQAQGITIDSARCFFRTPKREYIIIDAPGHIEFLKNMISGAARAEAGLLVIDAAEGVRENSRRHGYLMSMLGVRQIAVCVNKMDLVDYRWEVFESIRKEYAAFLSKIGLEPLEFIPISAREGENVVQPSGRMPWFTGPTILTLLDALHKESPPVDKPLRMPVQDVYKFTEHGDDRRIFVGRIETGSLQAGDEVVFLPSEKRSRIQTVEGFPFPIRQQAQAGQSTAVTLQTQVYVKPGELMVKSGEPTPYSSSRLTANLFWLSHNPMVMGKRYKLKLHSARATAFLTQVHTIIDASDLTTVSNRRQIERHDVAQVTLETLKPVACDPAVEISQTGRFVIIDDYEIAGGGVILSADTVVNTLVLDHVHQRNQAWFRSRISPEIRGHRHHQKPTLVLMYGPREQRMETLGRQIEEFLYYSGRQAYYLGLNNQMLGLDADLNTAGGREEFLRRLGEMSHLFIDAGMIAITTIAELDDFELDMIKTLIQPGELVLVCVGENHLHRNQPHLTLKEVNHEALRAIEAFLQEKHYIPEYQI